MTCREAERLVMPYINGSITDDELEEFLKHIDQCEECREELEIYFTVDVGTSIMKSAQKHRVFTAYLAVCKIMRVWTRCLDSSRAVSRAPLIL